MDLNYLFLRQQVERSRADRAADERVRRSHDSRSPGGRSDGVPKGDLACGPNSLFMFLILSGHGEVRRSDLDKIPVLPQGASLKALRDAAAAR